MFEEAETGGIAWARIFGLLDVVVLDVHETYRVDLDDDAVRSRLSWHWFVSRVRGLLSAPVTAYRPDGYPLPPNRLVRAISPPPVPTRR